MIKNTALKLLSYGIQKARCHRIKLFYFSAFCMFSVGCGKKVTNNEDQNEVRRDSLTVERIILDASLETNGLKDIERYSFKKDSEVRVPASIEVDSGNAGNNFAVIYFQANSTTNFQFYCKYQGGANYASPSTVTDRINGLIYHFHSCYKELNDQRPVTYYPGSLITQYQGTKVILEILSADPKLDTSASTELEVNWH